MRTIKPIESFIHAYIHISKAVKIRFSPKCAESKTIIVFALDSFALRNGYFKK